MAASPTSDQRTTHWDSVYNRLAENEVSWYQPTPACSLELLDDLGVGPTSSLVDIGAGTSRLVDVLLGRGFDDLTVLDVSAASLTQARHRLGLAADRVRWVVDDLLAWVPGRQFDVWHDRAAFHFLTDPRDVRRYRETLTAAVRPGGLVIVGTFAADGPSRCSGLPVARYSAEQLAGTLSDAVVVTASRREAHHTPAGGVQPFTWVAFRRRSGLD